MPWLLVVIVSFASEKEQDKEQDRQQQMAPFFYRLSFNLLPS
jgi:hypothetical protein